MEKIKIKNRILYRADEGKVLRFPHESKTFSEISLDKNDKRKIREVKE